MRTQVADSLDRVDASAWDRLAGEDDPFIEHAFLHGLEQTGCVGHVDSGWLPRHVLVWEGDLLVGAMPLYKKLDSLGEYIFDWGWAHAASRAGIPYYPKLVSAVPFTPATGSRLLIAPHRSVEPIAAALIRGALDLADAESASSLHLLFLPEAELDLAVAHGLMPRASYQFKWRRPDGWTHFGDYLDAMRASARKQVRRERRQAASCGLTLRMVTGEELGEDDWEALYTFYRMTAARKGAIPYLTADFFQTMGARLGHRVVAAFADDGRKAVAAALCFAKGRHLYGRYWGANQALTALHFELCYYQPIEWALTRNATLFEAGAQGSHKLKRGLLPELCHSAHWVRHPGLAEAVAAFLPQEALAVREEIHWQQQHSPFKALA